MKPIITPPSRWERVVWRLRRALISLRSVESRRRRAWQRYDIQLELYRDFCHDAPVSPTPPNPPPFPRPHS